MKRAEEVTRDLVAVAEEALSLSVIDMTIPWRGGLRTALQQNAIFKAGNSRADGFDKKSYHQSGMALDVIPWVDGEGKYFGVDNEFIFFAKIMFAVFEDRKEAGIIPEDLHLHWGGFWGAKDNDGDGKLAAITDKTGWDKAHWELRSYPQRNVLEL